MAENKDGIRSVERALAILGVLAENPDGIAPSPLAAQLGLPVSTCHRLLSTLEALGFAHRWAARGSYSIGYRLYELAARSGMLDTMALAAAKETMELLRDELGETCNLARREGLVARYIFQVAPETPVRLFTTVGGVVPLHSTGVGKVQLAHAPADVLESVALDLRPFSPTTITDRDALQQELALIRERGYALDNEEHQEGIMCVAVPIYDYTGALYASLSVAGPVNRIKRSTERIIPAAQAAGREISHRLGWETVKTTADTAVEVEAPQVGPPAHVELGPARPGPPQPEGLERPAVGALGKVLHRDADDRPAHDRREGAGPASAASELGIGNAGPSEQRGYDVGCKRQREHERDPR